MKIGTKSVLYGAHCFFLHPWFVAYAWYRLYGFPWDPRLWVVFFVHDLGYWGKPDMDGPEGEEHVFTGAKIVHWLFDEKFGTRPYPVRKEWYQLSFYHSRYMAKRYDAPPSKLCFADKMAWIYTPNWLYLPMVLATGECWEYMQKHSHECGNSATPLQWLLNGKAYIKAWVEKHINGTEDTWTKNKKNI